MASCDSQGSIKALNASGAHQGVPPTPTAAGSSEESS